MILRFYGGSNDRYNLMLCILLQLCLSYPTLLCFKRLHQRSMDARVESICANVATNAYKQLLPQEQALLTRFQSNEQIQSYVRDAVGNGGRLLQASEHIGKILRMIEPVSQSFVNSIPALYQPAKFLWGIFGAVVHVRLR